MQKWADLKYTIIAPPPPLCVDAKAALSSLRDVSVTLRASDPTPLLRFVSA